MSTRRKERHEIYMGDPTNIQANHGTKVSTPTGPCKEGMSEMPPRGGNAAYPKGGRINFGKDKLDVVP